MSFNRFAFAVLLFAAFVPPCAAAPAPDKKTRTAAAGSLETLVRRLDARIGRLIDPGALFRDKAFIQVFESPAPARDEALALLARADVSEGQKLIVVYAMQRLPLKDYVAFLERLLEFKRTGKVSRGVYVRGAFPNYDWSTALAENYRDPAVAAFLKKARAEAASEDEKAMIDEMLSGQAAAEVRAMREDGELGGTKAAPPKK